MKVRPVPFIMAVSISALMIACQSGGGDGDPGPTPMATGSWTWMSGATTASQTGVYGTKGLPDPANVPRSRYGASSWLDSQGNVWIFGGHLSPWGFSYLNDLWKFDPATAQWTWVSGADFDGQPGVYGTKGVADPANVPGARYAAAAWTDPQGRFWLFGGYGRDWANYNGKLNDLWMFDPASAQWTWIAGAETVDQPGVYGIKGVADAANYPGARERSSTWVDPGGKFWLFGGRVIIGPGHDGEFNDLWMFDPSTGQWTWVSGNEISTHKGMYGTKGQADASNVPGSRTGAVTWVGPGGRLWLFGGGGLDGSSDPGLLNDLWMFDPAAGLWTWISGSNKANPLGAFGTRGLSASTNVPGGRDGAATWIDAAGKLWLFGGFGYDSTDATGWLNDLWRFDPSSLEWVWVTGSKASGQSGSYGTLGTAAASNIPGARCWASSLIDAGGRVWLFGGASYDSTGNQGEMSDLWRYTR